MTSPSESERPTNLAPTSATSTIERLLLWIVGELALVGAVAWIAFKIQQDQIAPAVLFPLAVGAALGSAGSLLAHVLRTPPRSVAVVGAIVAGLLVVVAQDYVGHRYRVRQFSELIGRQEPLAEAAGGGDFARPEFLPYLTNKVRHETLWWSLDLMLTSAAAAIATAWALTNPRPARSDAPTVPSSSA